MGGLQDQNRWDRRIGKLCPLEMSSLPALGRGRRKLVSREGDGATGGELCNVPKVLLAHPPGQYTDQPLPKPPLSLSSECEQTRQSFREFWYLSGKHPQSLFLRKQTQISIS